MKLNGTQCVYVIYNPELNITKIGISDNVSVRKTALEASCGCRLTLHYNTKHIINARDYEMKIHDRLSDKRKLGEWFNILPEEAIEVVKEITNSAKEDPIIIKYKNGDSISKIADYYNVSRQAIIYRLRDYGIKKVKEVIERTIAEPIKPKMNCINYLDEEKPLLPLHKLKRLGPNIYFNEEWYQVNMYYNGSFIYAYSKNIDKANDFIKQTMNNV